MKPPHSDSSFDTASGLISSQEIRKNYWAHSIEGGLYFAGMAFISAELVLPSLIRSLGGSNLAISFSPTLLMVGFMLPPLFTAHLVEGLRRLKPAVTLFGGLHRIPYFIIAYVLLFHGTLHPELALYTTLIGLFVTGALFGLAMTAWMEFLDITIGSRRISSMMAIRNVIGAVAGVIAGFVIEYVLRTRESPEGYGILFLIAAILTGTSYLVFLTIGEPEQQHRKPAETVTFWQNIKGTPAMLKRHPNMRRLLISNFTFTGIFIITPFMGIHAVDTTGKGESFIGELVTMSMIGSIFGNILAGYWGDRIGPKTPMVIARAMLAVFCIGMLLNTHAWGFKILFFGYGMAFYMNMSARMAMGLEVCGAERRPTYMALMTTSALVCILLASFVSAGIRNWTGSLTPAAICSGIAVSLSLYYLTRVQNPRKRRA